MSGCQDKERRPRDSSRTFQDTLTVGVCEFHDGIGAIFIVGNIVSAIAENIVRGPFYRGQVGCTAKDLWGIGV